MAGQPTRRRRVARVAAVVALAAAAVTATAAPAAAHARATDELDDYDSRVVAEPDLPGVTWELGTAGLFVEVANHGEDDLVVLGYDGEPYLRVGPGGAFVNLNSPATYLNEETDGDVAVPPRADPDAAPEWERERAEPWARWHDHRTHWMSDEPPPEVQADPGTARRVSTWELPVEHAGEVHALEGELWWEPVPVPWIHLAVALALCAPALPFLRRGRRSARRAAAALVAVVAAVNLLHVVDEIVARPDTVVDVAYGIGHTLLFVGAGLVGAGWAWRGGRAERAALGVAAGAVLLHQGLLHLPLLWASQLPTVWPDAVVRTVVLASLAQAAVAGLALVAMRRPAAEGANVPADQGRSSQSSTPLNV